LTVALIGESAQAQGEVVVHGTPRRRDATDLSVPAEQAAQATGTEGDPVKVVEDLPGVARPSFGSGQLVVWGAAPSETRTYVDGVEIPTLFHGNALRSTINGDLVRDITLTPGAYGPDYGRALGGMLRVETKDLPDGGVHGYVGADTLDGGGIVTAALGERVRVGLAGRYGWLHDELRAVGATQVDAYFPVPRYADYQAKAQVTLRSRESVDAVVLGSTDALSIDVQDADPSHARSQTTRASYERVYLRYRRLLDDGAAVDVVPFVGRDASSVHESFGERPAMLDTATLRWGLRASHRSRPFERLVLSLGVDLDGSSAHVFRQGSLLVPPREGDVRVFGQPPGDDTNADTWNAGVVDVGPYASMRVEIGPLTLSPGLRADMVLLQTSRRTPRVGATPSVGLSDLEAAVEPRAAANLRVTPKLAVLAAAGLYSQPPDPADLSAVFGNPTLGAAHAEHASLGGTLLLSPSLSLETVGFYRSSRDLAVRDPSATPPLAGALLQQGTGRAYGVQFLLRQQPWHGLFGWVAYTVSRSERRDAPGARWRLFDDDQSHVLTVVATKRLDAWSVGLRLRYARGLPGTPVIGALYDAKDDVYQPIFGPQNSTRLPDFWQVDLRVDRRVRMADAASLLVYLELLNVTNRTNGEAYVYNIDYTQRGTVRGLPATAVVGVRAEL
jgi:hypothetical protein